MGKALVIRGASFLENRITTVNLEDEIPCTGISLSQSSISFTSINSTVQLTATVTPQNTTDELIWESSNDNIATVESGLVTCVGVGSATITVTCGNQTATCSVSATHTFVIDDAYHAENGYKYSGSLNLSADPPHNGIGKATLTRGRLYYSTVEYGNYRVFANKNYAGEYAVPIPNGASTVSVQPPEGLQTLTYFVLCNVNEKQTYVTGEDGNAALGLAVYEKTSGSYPWEVDFSDVTGANGFILTVIGPSGTDASENTGKTSITFS